MTDNHANSSIIKCIISIHIKKRILKNTRRKTNLIRGRIIICIDSLRSHSPFISVNRLACLGQHIIQFEFCSTLHIGPIRIFFNIQTGIIPPLIRIAYLYIKRIQLLNSFNLCAVTHPFQIPNTFSQCGLQILYQLHHTFFCGCRKIFLHIHLTYRFTQYSIYSTYSTLPTRLVSLFAG